ncbi:MAG: hypothetical protein HXY22_09435 [Alphaproteobacteria bacterium]|nr:hypothetical protein [Alphaproteobacteria bacterium]
MAGPSLRLLEGLKRRYAEPHRAYHTWEHIEALLRHFRTYEFSLADPAAVLWAIYWHDAVYDPIAKDNEEKSASLLLSEAGNEAAKATLEKASIYIRATRYHQLPEELPADALSDCGLFLDLDLSILAAPSEVFDTYEAAIRREYAFVPEDRFRQGRGTILKDFLRRPRLYFSAAIPETWETLARANLRRSIAMLSGDAT